MNVKFRYGLVSLTILTIVIMFCIVISGILVPSQALEITYFAFAGFYFIFLIALSCVIGYIEEM